MDGKKSIILGLTGYAVFNIISAFSPGGMWEMFFITRFIAGFFLILVMVQPFPYLEEFLPVKVRGRMTTYLASGWPIGTMMLIGAVYLFEPLYGWQGVVLFSSVIAIIWLIAITLVLPESPYYLVGANKQHMAKEIINNRIMKKRDFVSEDVELYTEDVKRGSFIELFRKKYLASTVLIFFANFFFSFGYWGLFAWLPTILGSRGFTFVTTLEYVFVAAIAQFPGYFAASYLEEKKKLGRKWVLIPFLIASGFATFLFAYSTTLAVMLFALVVLSFFNLGGWGVWDVWQPELYPTNIRGTLMGWIGGAQRISNSLAPFMLGFLLATGFINFMGIVILVSISLFITAVIVYPLRETRGEILA